MASLLFLFSNISWTNRNMLGDENITRNPIIPENTSKRKFLIWQQMNLTIVDLAVLILFAGIGIGICLLMWKLSIGLKIVGILVASFFIIMGFLLNSKSQFHNKKIYVVIFEGIIFLFINRKYKLESKNCTTNLIPYLKIEDNYI
ncbi:hypothetical protein SCANT_v1c04580 [Spiroplasma cantharicola]|uniref:Transmembrane protein n=2 Tax=Spiroplasma cantharicola TaxID=362837 RepID=A0A0M3SJ99_9MOLU|nr:hypothetical protein SCANT_v1c04580 [Spiroplasma cantharicola]